MGPFPMAALENYQKHVGSKKKERKKEKNAVTFLEIRNLKSKYWLKVLRDDP